MLAAGVFWFDAPISAWAHGLYSRLGGDPKKALETAGQYGQGTIIGLTAIVILLLDLDLRRRLLDWAAGLAVTAAIVLPAKMLIGRPRPKFEDPFILLGPWGAYPVSDEVGVRHAWETGAGISADLWSMPSAHTAYAVAMSAFLWVVYPRLRPVAVAMAVLVGCARVMLGKHYPSDVFVGAAIGLGACLPAVRGYWGTRLLDRIWRIAVDRSALPAEPSLRAAEAKRHGAV